MHLANPMPHKMRATNMPVVVAGDEMSPLNEIHRLIEQNELFLNTKKKKNLTMDVCKYPRTYYEKYVPFYSSAIGNPRQHSKSVIIASSCGGSAERRKPDRDSRLQPTGRL